MRPRKADDFSSAQMELRWARDPTQVQLTRCAPLIDPDNDGIDQIIAKYLTQHATVYFRITSELTYS